MGEASSEDELGSYDPTTPKPQRRPAPRPKQTTNAVAGPSSKPPPKRGAKRTNKATEEDVEMVDLRSDEDVQVTAPAPKKAKVASAGKATSADKVGAPSTQVKGKAKSNGSDDVTIMDDAHEEPQPQRSRATKQPTKANHTANSSPVPTVSVAEHERIKRQNERLQKQLEEASIREKSLTDQLEEVFRLRNTEPEELLAREREVFDAKLQTQELLNAEQAKLISASNSGFLHFLSREDADKEKKEAEDNVLHWKKIAARKDEQLKEQQAQIQQLEKELKLEVDRAKSLATRNPPTNGRRGGTVEPDGGTQAAVVGIYESISNILIMNASTHASEYPGKEEHIFTCIYTTPNPTSNMIGALNFTLREMWQLIDDELARKVEYQPRDLDKERPELVEKLDFFAEAFVFAHDQLHVFFKTMAERFEAMKTEEEEEEEEENEVEEVVEIPRPS